MRQAVALGSVALVLMFGMVASTHANSADLPPQENEEEATTEEHGTATEQDEHGETEAHDGDESDVGHQEHRIKNEVAFFLGATDEEGHATEFTLAADYKRRVADRLAVGGFVDYAGGDLRNTVVGALLFWWPTDHLSLYAGPGVEYHNGRDQDGSGGDDGHGEGDEGHGGADPNETFFVFRVGVGWGFEIAEHYGIIPTVSLDLVEGEKVWIYGVAVTYAW